MWLGNESTAILQCIRDQLPPAEEIELVISTLASFFFVLLLRGGPRWAFKETHNKVTLPWRTRVPQPGIFSVGREWCGMRFIL